MVLELRVLGPGGFICNVAIGVKAIVEEAQMAIQAETGIEPLSQRLFYGLQELRAGDTLDRLLAPAGPAEVLLVRRSPQQVAWLRELEALKFGAVVWLSIQQDAASDREVVLAAVSKDGSALEHAAKELQADREVVLRAVTTSFLGTALRHADELLRADREIVLAAMGTSSGMALRYAAEELRADREIVLAAMSREGMALRFAAEEFWADREIVLAAVAKTGMALRFAAEALRADREIVLAAVATSSGMAMQFAAKELRADRDFVRSAMARIGSPPPVLLGTSRKHEELQSAKRVRVH